MEDARRFAVYYREDAQGSVARYGGQRASAHAFGYAEAEEIRQGSPNGSQMETREVER